MRDCLRHVFPATFVPGFLSILHTPYGALWYMEYGMQPIWNLIHTYGNQEMTSFTLSTKPNLGWNSASQPNHLTPLRCCPQYLPLQVNLPDNLVLSRF
ncbi:hypothetical protein HZ326_31708 [Fusarium oxysporum f. sp. albedinis]|nr:hypothetical protein HZ326_31708 [Fusarium oxysporum f. sp. albedinis]